MSTPAGRSILLLGMMTYFLLFACLMGGMHLAIDATAGERERGSLEPLLTLPVTRAALVLGKLLATSVFMAASLAIAVVAFAIAIMFLPLSTIGMTAHFGAAECFSIFVIMLPFVVLGAGLMSVVASYTKTFREAQSYTSIAMLAPTLPIIFAALNPMQPSLTLMLVPSLSQHLLVTSVIKTEPIELAHLAMSMASTLAFGLLLAALAMHRYRSEKLLI
ncbi:MAG: ABC transporter permease subunit [Gammaproteobacteria bacterium]